MTYQEAESLVRSARRPEAGKPVANNTRVRKVGDDFAVRLHDTDVVLIHPDDTFSLFTGGWLTVTTKERINRFAPARVGSERGVWYVFGRNWEDRSPFFEGVRVDVSGRVLNPEPQDKVKARAAARRKMEKRIADYVAKVRAALPLDPPSQGDCWYCVMRTETGQSLGDAFADTHHLTEHMREGYVVPALVFNAIEEAHYNNPAFIFQYGGADTIGRVVRRYLTKRLIPDKQAR